jgi:hypothetical protein
MKLINYFPLYLTVALFAGCSSAQTMVKRGASATSSDAVVWTSNIRSESEKNSYRVVLNTPKNTITGICILKKTGDEWRGTLINEMGAKAFDFIVTGERCELVNVISMMDKGYVKKVVAADLFFLFNADNPEVAFYKHLERFEQQGNLIINYKKKQLVAEQGGPVVLLNNRNNLRYELKKIIDIDPNKLIE